MAKKTDHTEERIHVVEDALSRTEKFIEKNQKIITIAVGAIVVIVLVFMGFRKFYLQPREKEALSQMFMAEKYFEQDSLDLALYGDGNYLGFLQIIDDYGITKTADLAHYYAGLIYLKKGEFENAIDYLKDFDGNDQIVSSMAKGATGDAYMELGETDKAIGYYLNAANDRENNLISPVFLMKAAWGYEIQEDYDEALELYKKIKKEYYRSYESREIDKYIEHAKGLMESN